MYGWGVDANARTRLSSGCIIRWHRHAGVSAGSDPDLRDQCGCSPDSQSRRSQRTCGRHRAHLRRHAGGTGDRQLAGVLQHEPHLAPYSECDQRSAAAPRYGLRPQQPSASESRTTARQPDCRREPVPGHRLRSELADVFQHHGAACGTGECRQSPAFHESAPRRECAGRHPGATPRTGHVQQSVVVGAGQSAADGRVQRT